MPTEPNPITLFQVVHRAVEVCDPGGDDTDLADLLVRFEDADEPVLAILDGLELRMAEAVGALDPDSEIPSLQMAAAVATYLGHRRDELEDDPEQILRLAARAEFDGHPPAHVENWLEEQGVSV